VKIKFTSKIIIFQKTLEFKYVIALYYGKQQSLTLQGCVPSLQVWAITQIVFNTLGPMVKQCVLNQSQGHLLFFDVFCCDNINSTSNVSGLYDTIFQ